MSPPTRTIERMALWINEKALRRVAEEAMMEARRQMCPVARLVFDRVLVNEDFQREYDRNAMLRHHVDRAVHAPDDETAIAFLTECLVVFAAEHRASIDRLVAHEKTRLPEPIVIPPERGGYYCRPFGAAERDG